MKLLFALLLFLFTVKGICQYATAGVPGLFYTDINPDTLLTGGYYVPAESYFIDINEDGINDIKIRTYYSSGFGGSVTNVKVEALNGLIDFALGSIDSTYSIMGGNWIVRSILKQYSLGDSINSNSYSPISSGYVGYFYGTNGTGASSPQWVNVGDKCFGVRYTDTFGSKYGWVKINVTNSFTCLIKEFSFGEPLSVDINHINDSEDFISIFPNPTSREIRLQCLQRIFVNTQPIVYDPLGRKVFLNFVLINSKTWLADVQTLPAGVYYLTLLTDKGYVKEKMIVQH